MCTVSFFPPAHGGFILSSNRDERLSRSNTLPPAAYAAENETHYFPRDQESTGTWIACSSSGKTYCLLNGALEGHVPKPPYRKSRGLVLLELLSAPLPEKYLLEKGLEGIEPFTLVMVSGPQEELTLQELRWDGNQYQLQKMNAGLPHIWSSSTLYPAEIRAARENWFRRWLQENPAPSQQELLHFHRFGGAGDGENGLVMQRSNDRQTISITSVQLQNGRREMYYEDLIQGIVHQIVLS